MNLLSRSLKIMQHSILSSVLVGHACSIQLELHFDVNGTIMASDMAQGRGNKSSVLQEIAKETSARWDENGEKITYRDYVDNVIHPGDEVKDQSLKRQRRQQYENIITHLEDRKHPQYSSVKDRFDRIMSCLEKQDSLLFKSFWKLVEWLEIQEKDQGLQYKIVFRTFGHDIPAIQETLIKKGFCCDHLTSFKNGQLVSGDKTHDLNDHKTIVSAIAVDKFNAVQDDWKHWNTNGEKREFGKPFYVSNGSSLEVEPIRIFFDDNVIEKEIIYPLTKEGIPVNVQGLIDKGLLVNVKTLDAIADEDYFIERIKPFV